MNQRVSKLRTQSLETQPTITLERAELVTQAYEKYEGRVSTPMLRALAFQHIMEQKTICINDGELIVGERGGAPKETPTYPELCCHSLEDLEVIHARDTINFDVSDTARDIQSETMIPFWQERSIRSQLFPQMTREWLDCYAAGIFTEFMEQRAPGHTVGDKKIFTVGFLEFKERIAQRLAEIPEDEDPVHSAQREQLQAMAICADAIITFGQRHAEKAEAMAAAEQDPQRRQELAAIATVCRRVPGHAPRNFWEALQAYWFVHLGVITELNTWDAFNPGRLDQHLEPFYSRGLAEGSLTRDSAKELLQCFWVKFNNQPAPPKVGVTLKESGTYTDFANINVGGLKVDGSDGVNDVSYLLLEVIDEMALTQPSSNVQLSKRNPEAFLRKAADVIRKGRGQPSLFNADAVVAELLRQGKTIEDARCGGNSGCVETGAFGKEAYILTGYFNLVKVLEITLHNGLDPQTGKQLGPQTGAAVEFASFEQLLEAFQAQLHHFIGIKMEGNDRIERLYAEQMPSPFLSIIVDDCIAKAKDYNAGGARYNTSYIQGVGIGTITDSLSSLRRHVFEEKTFTMAQLLQALDDDFTGHDKTQQWVMNRTPKYGNDDDAADQLMVTVFNMFLNAVDGRPNQKGGTYRINMLPTTCHVYFGSVIGATPDGRRAGRPLSEGISPVQGADRHGPTAVINSAAKMDHIKTGGTLLNQKFTPKLAEGEVGLTNMAALVRAYFRLDGHHIQFNVVSAAELRRAQERPDEFRDLIVRVAGYSDYFSHLSRALQDEIIERTEHQSMS